MTMGTMERDMTLTMGDTVTRTMAGGITRNMGSCENGFSRPTTR